MLVEEQSNWWALINARDDAQQEVFAIFEDNGYSKEQVRDYLKALKEKPIDELVALALKDDSNDSPALIVLQQSTSRNVFDKAKQLCASEKPKDRILGVEIMMRQQEVHFKSEAVKTVSDLVKVENENAVLEVLAYALCHLDVDDRSHYLKHIAKSPAAETRMAAAYSLSSMDDDIAVGLLIDLSADQDDDVRNWATFGLQPRDKELPDSQEIRDALFARVDDPHDETRHEALLGLAEYKDPRVIAPLIEALTAEAVWELAVEAAEEIGHPQLHSHLLELRGWWDANPKLLDRAITACAPSSDVHPSSNSV